ncbi:MAG: YggT family protein [Spirochaetes bacterium]|nr:YggT family protein [Spirochaetota bacterium]
MRVIGTILLAASNALLLLLTVRVIFSWLTLPPSQFTYWLNRITDPILNFFKKRFPIRVGILDLSILVPFFILSILNKVIIDVFINFAVNRVVFYMIEVLFFAADSLLITIITVMVIITAIQLLTKIFLPYSYNPIVNSIKSILDPILLYFRRIIPIKSVHNEKIYLVILIALLILVGFVGRYLLAFVLNLLNGVVKF